MQNRLFIPPQIVMRLWRRLALRLVNELFDTRNVAIVRIRQKNNLVLRVSRQHLRHRAELGREIRVSE